MTTEIEEKPSTAVTVIERAALALGADEGEKELIALSKKYVDIVAITNKAGRDQVHSAAMELGTARIDTDKTGKAAREDANAFQTAVIAEAKRRIAIVKPEEDRLLALRDKWDAEREAEKIAKALAESKRITEIRQKIEEIRDEPRLWLNKPSADIGVAADHLSERVISLDEYSEYTEEARAERDNAVKQLRAMQEAMRTHEEAQAELVRRQAELAEQERLAAVTRAEQEERDRQERERVAAEQAEAAARAAETMRREREAHDARMAEQQAELDAKQAVIDAAIAEQERVAREIREVAEAEERRRQEEAEAAARAEADRIQAEKDAAEAESARVAALAAEEERQARAAREAADTAMRNAASALYAALVSQVSWAGEVSDEFLDGEPGLREQFVADRKAAADALKLARGEA